MAADASAQHHQPHRTNSGEAPRPAPPAPSFIFRGHDAPVHSLEFFASNSFLASGDEAGWIVIWDLWKRRQIHRWHGHPTGSVIALKAIPIRVFKGDCQSSQETSRNSRNITTTDQDLERALSIYLVSHGRDNQIHIWDISTVLYQSQTRKVTLTSTGHTNIASQNVTLAFSLPVNAVNFCKMSILAVDAPSIPKCHRQVQDQKEGERKYRQQNLQEAARSEEKAWSLADTHQHIYIAVPSPTTTTLIDIYDIVKPERCFASIGHPKMSSSGPSEAEKRWGSVMAIQLFETRSNAGTLERPLMDSSNNPDTLESLSEAKRDHSPKLLHMIVGYEDGSVTLFQEHSSRPSSHEVRTSSKPKRVMDMIWTVKCHREPVLGLDLSSDLRFVVSAGSDNLLVKYNLFGTLQGVPEVMQLSLKAGGIAQVRVRNDNRIVALAGWDGRIRVFSAKTLKPLAVLKHHREGLYCLDIAQIREQSKNTDQLTDAAADKKGTEEAAKSREDNSGSESDSDAEDAVLSRREWARRHWIAAAGKENRISLWELY